MLLALTPHRAGRIKSLKVTRATGVLAYYNISQQKAQ